MPYLSKLFNLLLNNASNVDELFLSRTSCYELSLVAYEVWINFEVRLLSDILWESLKGSTGRKACIYTGQEDTNTFTMGWPFGK
jgi:hypothetical protein